MKVSTGSWQSEASKSVYRSVSKETLDSAKTKDSALQEMKNDDMQNRLFAASGKSSEKSGSNFKMKSSAPDESVGQLASELARAETRMDVQQVSSKAMRALANLKMASVASEGKEAKKIAQMIRRMEKLIKRISKKMQHLSKEEQIENQRKRAEKKEELQKAQELAKELSSRRRKRKRDERGYALKEMAEDNKNSAADVVSSLNSAISASTSVPDLSSVADIGGVDLSAIAGGSIDISV
ncbi:MAG: hypothetical protein HFG54_06690 [Lachnospiraceae bacterium]|jgi:hypothetical protein|nr:hypothetical protein [Lachnospiraceae bacterium]